MDNLSTSQRRKAMAAVKSKDTSPELVVRRLVHSLGYRYRLHRPDLPGKPDLVFVGKRKVIFVHGCFWHRHNCDAGRSMPATNRDYWQKKFDRNKSRDIAIRRALRKAGWKVLIVWECETRQDRLQRLASRITEFLG